MKIQMEIEDDDKTFFQAITIMMTFIWVITVILTIWFSINYESTHWLFFLLITIGLLIFDTVIYMILLWQWLHRKLKSMSTPNIPKPPQPIHGSIKKLKNSSIKD